MRMALVKLVDPSHRLPHPFNPQIDFPKDGMEVDVESPVWMALIRDRSLEDAGLNPEPKRRKETV